MVICFVVVPAAALAVSLGQEKKYTASASLLFRDPAFDQKLFGSTVAAPSRDADRDAATNLSLVSLEVVADRTARRLDRGLLAAEVVDKVEVSAEGKSDVVSIAATDADPQQAARLANTFAREYISFRRDADRSKIQEAQQLVETELRSLSPSDRTGPERRSLLQRSEQLQILASLQTGNAELVQAARAPTDPSSPKPLRNTALGLMLGLVLGGALAFLFDRLDRRVKDPKELEKSFDRPILAAIPESRALGRSSQDARGLPASEAEAFRMLRANLRYFNVDREIRSVLVTSAAPGDGKSTVAWYLAVAAADSGSRVLLIEADLRHPSLSGRLGLSAALGLSQVLAGEINLQPAINQVPVTWRKGGSVRTLDVVLAGYLPPNPTDLMESKRMQDIIRSAERDYDLVVIDTPPTSVVSDAIPLVSEVSGILVVSRLGKSTREATAHLRSQLENLNAPTLGVVINSVDLKRGAYGYAYGYGEGYGASANGSEESGGVMTPARAPRRG